MSNVQKINNAFAKFTQDKDRIIRKALEDILQDAVDEALIKHEGTGHTHHLDIGDNYGWMLFYNGAPVSSRIYTTRNNEGIIRSALQGLGSTSVGYEGVVAAGMTDISGSYYSLRFELDVLRKTINYTIQTGTSHF